MVEFEDGNQPTISTEELLFEIDEQSLPRNYNTWLFFEGLQEGDEIIYRVYVYNPDAASYSVYYERPANWNTLNLGKERAIRIPWTPTTNYKVTLQKVAGANSTVRFFYIITDIP